MEDDEQPLDAPDPSAPLRSFRDGTDVFEIWVQRSRMPLIRYETIDAFRPRRGDGILIVLAMLLIYLLTWPFDRRWKVAVWRTRHWDPADWRVVKVEFFDSEPEADSRWIALLHSWEPGQFANKIPMSSADIRRRRRAHHATCS